MVPRYWEKKALIHRSRLGPKDLEQLIFELLSQKGGKTMTSLFIVIKVAKIFST